MGKGKRMPKVKKWFSSKGRAIKSGFRHRFGRKADGDIEDLPEFASEAQAHARKGILYLFGCGTAVDGSLASVIIDGSLGAVAGGYGADGSINGDMASKWTSSAVKAGAQLPVQLFKVLEDKGPDGFYAAQRDAAKAGDVLTLSRTLETIAKKCKDKVEEKLNYKKEGIPFWTQIVKKLCLSFASRIASELTPLSGIADITKGVLEGGYAAVRRIDAAIARRNTSWLVGGHTEQILDALERAMHQSMGEGALRVLKGGLGVGLETVTAGAGKIASLVMGFVEMVYKIVWRLKELSIIEDFLADAKHYWTEAKSGAGLHDDGDAFAAWYGQYATSAPVIACTTLNSGICGSAWEYLNLYSGDGLVATQAQFDKGTSYLNRLRPYAAWYQKKSGVFFHSTDPIVEKILKAAKDRTIKYTGMEAERKVDGKKTKFYKKPTVGEWLWDLGTS